jgi:predicted Zn-dependent peptidase
LPYHSIKNQTKIFPSFKINTSYESRSLKQAHFCLGFSGVAYSEEKKVNILSVLNALLNGGMRSRLFATVREKLGLTYTLGTYRLCYRNTGIFVVYAATQPNLFEKLRDALLEELQKISMQRIDDSELIEAKNKVIANFCFNMENLQFRMTRIAQAEFYYGNIPNVSQVISGINAVTSQDIQSLANEIFDLQRMSIAAIGPFENISQ